MQTVRDAGTNPGLEQTRLLKQPRLLQHWFKANTYEQHTGRRDTARKSFQTIDGSVNLGALSRTLDDRSVSTEQLLPPPASYAFVGGTTIDAPAIFASTLLLMILLGISFERILGLDRIVANALREWKAGRTADRRRKMIEARDSMERMFGEEADPSDQ